MKWSPKPAWACTWIVLASKCSLFVNKVIGVACPHKCRTRIWLLLIDCAGVWELVYRNWLNLIKSFKEYPRKGTEFLDIHCWSIWNSVVGLRGVLFKLVYKPHLVRRLHMNAFILNFHNMPWFFTKARWLYFLWAMFIQDLLSLAESPDCSCCKKQLKHTIHVLLQ